MQKIICQGEWYGGDSGGCEQRGSAGSQEWTKQHSDTHYSEDALWELSLCHFQTRARGQKQSWPVCLPRGTLIFKQAQRGTLMTGRTPPDHS